MKKFLKIFLIGLIAVLVVASLLRISKGVQAQTRLPTTYGSETWTTGVTVEIGTEYSAISGRMVTNAASFRSNRDTFNIYYIFPAPAGNRTVTQARFNILTLNGTPSGRKTMTLEVFSLDGTFLRTLSENVDVLLSAQNAWEDFILNADSAELLIAPGEFLSVHFSTEVLENFEFYPVFEIVTE